MALHAKDPDADPDWLDEWPLGVRRPFMASQAFNVLQRDLRRYLRGEVAGRSILISGHRGAGKTALVARAIQDCEREVMTDAVRPIDPRQRSLPPQRPLLVKLHGPTLLAIDAPKPAAPAEPIGSGPAVVITATAGAAPAKAAEDKADKPAATTLSLITIALYRALAAEAAKAYAIHAREEQGLRGGDFAEVAGQLVLELDRAPPPGSIRAFWARLDRLGPGVLWPRRASWRGGEGVVNDQGVREVIALATAAQAFRVCTGKENDTEKDTGAASDEQERTSAAKLDLADTANKLLGLAAGAAATAALYATRGAGALTATDLAAGVAVGLVSTLSLGWTNKRRLARKMTREYTFIPDRSPQNLDRDLPLVIERIRDAGLAPVFVIDELDKVEHGEQRIGAFINNLKHLITDFGFFCFLTDRDYFEYVQRTLNSAAFPREHTYFSQRQFILYRPDEFKGYLTQILTSDAAQASNADQLALKVFPLVLLHRSKLNTVAMIREVARSCDQDGRLRAESGAINTVLAYRLPATVQLAIDHILRGGELAERLEVEPVFAQTMIDALYRISRAWEDEATEIDCSVDAVRIALAQRIKRAEVETAEEARRVVAAVLGEVDVRMILTQSDRLLAYLTDFSRLEADLKRAPPAEGVEVLPIIPLQTAPGLLARKEAGSAIHVFQFDAFGLDQRAAPAAAARSDESGLLRLVDGFRDFCARIPVDPARLTKAGVLPATVDWEEVIRAADTLRAPHGDAQATNAATSTLKGFQAFLRRRGRVVATVLWIARDIANQAGLTDSARIATALEAMDRYDPLIEAIEGSGDPAAICPWYEGPRPVIPAMPPQTRMVGWLGAVGEQLATSPAPGNDTALADRQGSVFDRWARLFQDDPTMLGGSWPKHLDNVVLAAAALAPSAFLRADGHTVSLLEWSELALVCLGRGGGPVGPDRTAVAMKALDVLGFGRGAIVNLAASPLGQTLSPDLLEQARQSGPPHPGVAMVVDDGPSVATAPPTWADDRPPPPSESTPILAIPNARLDDYIEVLDWLISEGVITAVTEEV